eukprot:12998-Heterococcus_DN1.PRE.2
MLTATVFSSGAIIASKLLHIDTNSFYAGVDVNAMANSGGTALMFAAVAGHLETCKVIQQLSYIHYTTQAFAVHSIHTQNAHTVSTRKLACMLGYCTWTTLVLLDAGAKVNTAVAATPEYLDYIAEQLKEGTEGAEPHKDGVTSLMLAAQYGHADVVRLLLKHGADIDVKVCCSSDAPHDSSVYNALPNAVITMPDGTCLATAGTNTLASTVSGSTTTTAIAAAGVMHASSSWYDDEDVTALQEAVRGSFLEAATALVEAGADPNQAYADDAGNTQNMLYDIKHANNDGARTNSVRHAVSACCVVLVWSASDQNLISNVKFVLYAVSCAHAHTAEGGLTTLTAAVAKNLPKVVEKLLTVVDKDYINKKSDQGITPLLFAANQVRSPFAVQSTLLIVTAPLYSTALLMLPKPYVCFTAACHCITTTTHMILLESSLQKCYCTPTAASQAHTTVNTASSGYAGMVKALIKAGADVDTVDADETTALMASAASAHLEVVEVTVLKEKYADYLTETADGGAASTALMDKAIADAQSMVALLTRSGADPELKCKEGKTAKDYGAPPETKAAAGGLADEL